MERIGFEELKRDVIDRGLCTACGQCIGICPRQALRVSYDSGEIVPTLTGDCKPCDLCYQTCPGENVPYPDLERMVFGRERKTEEHRLGIWRASFRGHSSNPEWREKSSSGGASTALFAYALDQGLLDGVVFAALDPDLPFRAKGVHATTSQDFLARKVGSFYSPVANNAALSDTVIKHHLDRIGLVGCGCHIQAARMMQLGGRPLRLAKSIALTIGLFCSSNYYFAGTEHLVEEFGRMPLSEVQELDYRGGDWPGHLVVKTRDGATHTILSKHDYTWHFMGAAPYKRDRCIMCPDFGAELADISIGDIYVPTDDNPRWGVILVRTEIGERMVRGAVDAGYLHIVEHSPELIPQSGLGWEAQKHAAVYRLQERKKHGWPTPDYHMDLPIQFEHRKKLYFK